MTDLHTAQELLGLTSGLKSRRRRAQYRRAFAALCAGLAVFCALQVVANSQEQSTVLVASQQIDRGSRIRPSMVKLVSLPASALSAHLLTSKGQATGKIAQIGLTAGQPLLAQAVSPAPLLPTGATSVRLALASAPESLLPGQKVELIASTDCSHPLPPAPGSQQPPTSGQCLVAQQALTMQLPATADEQASGSKNAAGSTASGFTTFALQAEDALRALGLPENAAIIAVYQAPTANPQPSQQAARP